MSQSEPIDAKVVVLGSASVGKTSIICRSVSDEFDQAMPSTIGASYSSKEIEVGGVTINLQIWDTAGQERFRTLAPMYYRNSLVALLVFSITDDRTLQDVKSWAAEMKQQAEKMPTLFVIGNKSDLEDQRRVLAEEGAAIAKELSASYVEVSAKTGQGIDELFVSVAEEAATKLHPEQSTPSAAPSVSRSQNVQLASTPASPKGKGCNC
jgi:small GTP-binding protein